MTTTRARRLADSAWLLTVATGGDLADALDALLPHRNPEDRARVARLRETLRGTR
jgi:hypothetical protein